MLDESKKNLLIQIFIEVDDFTQAYERHLKSKLLPQFCQRRPGPCRMLVDSEIMTLLIFYHHSGYKCFQYYYESCVLGELRDFFPQLVGYQRFVELIPKVGTTLYLYSEWMCSKSQRTQIYFADSKKLPVCDNKRIHSNRVFEGVAKRGKTSTGWFYGLKLHLIINNLGEIVEFLFTPANISDNNEKVLDKLLYNLHGKCFADKGYLTRFFEKYAEKGIQLVTKIRKNMKNTMMNLNDKYWLRKRAVIESVNDLLMSVFDIDHTRHRNPWNAIIHAIGGLCAYQYYPIKPSVFIPRELA